MKLLLFILNDLADELVVVDPGGLLQQKEDLPPKDPDLLTKNQLKYIHILAKEKGVDPSLLKAYSASNFGKDSSKDLTRSEASHLIKKLQSIKPKSDDLPWDGGDHV